MRSKFVMRGFFVLLWLAMAGPAFGQVANIIPATNRIDWIPGVTIGVFGGIPTNRAVFTNLSAGASLASINAAIAACPSNQTVKLAAGSYTINGILDLKSGVTLKGAGDRATILNEAGGSVRMLGTSTASAPSTNLAGGYTKGSTNLVLSAGGPAVAAGNYLLILQDNDTNLVQIYSGATNKMTVDTVRVTGVTGGGLNVEFWPPLAYGFGAAFTPRYVVKTGPFIEYAGVEDLFIDPDAASSYPIERAQAFSCWIKNVVITNVSNMGIHDYGNLQCETRHVDHLKAATGGDGYGTEVDVDSSANWDGSRGLWIENCIGDGLYHFILTSGNVGCVASYCFATNEHASSGVAFPTASFNAAHSAGGRMTLWEGNWGSSYFTTDIVHGNTTHQVLWRNRFAGFANAASDTNAHMPMLWLGKGSWWYFAVGNVLGAAWSAPGAHRVYKYTGATWSAESSSDNGGILFLGFTGGAEEAKVGSTFTGWRNYDFYHAAIYDETSVAGSPTVDDSLLYGSKPDWFGDRPWPPIDPGTPNADVTVLPAAYRYVYGVDPPAQNATSTPGRALSRRRAR